MCGIAGAVFWDEVPTGIDPMATVGRMTAAVAHRGPDGEGLWRCAPDGDGADGAPTVVLGHRRLAIIDLTSRAAQPMIGAAGRIAVTYNGEIYNFGELRCQLESLGHRFRSDSDTEVLLLGYEQWGLDVVPRLRGMFAFAIWDRRSQTLLLARDRLGIKPLYVHRSAGYLVFASELRAVLASGLVPRRLDPAAVGEYLAYQTVPPPRTLVQGVEMLEPAHVAVASPRRRWRDEQYWDLLDRSASSRVPRQAAAVRARVGQLLAESTALHLIGDVPVGIFLSGGIDSTVLAALARAAGVTPRTFTVTFPGTSFDEARDARATAEALDATHTEIALTEDALVQALPDALGAVDHPSGDGINTFVVTRAVRAAGLKVALSGLGGDELFGGYPSFRRLRRLAGLARGWRYSPRPVRRLAAAAVRTLGGSSTAATKTAALVETDGALPVTYPLMRQLFPEHRRLQLLAPGLAAARLADDPYERLLHQAMAKHPDAELMTLVSYAEARTYMHDVLLRDTDQMAMHHGLEVRVPLLDHVLVEEVMGLPDWAKRPDGLPKRLLVEAVGGALLPAVARRPKQGFVLPFDVWMRGQLRPFCEHHLGASGLGGRALFRAGAIQSVWHAFLDRRGETWSRPWALVALNAWMERVGVTS